MGPLPSSCWCGEWKGRAAALDRRKYGLRKDTLATTERTSLALALSTEKGTSTTTIIVDKMSMLQLEG